MQSMIRLSSVHSSVLGFALLFAVFTSPSAAQPNQPPNLLDSIEIQQLQDSRSLQEFEHSSGRLILPHSFLEDIKPESLIRIQPNQTNPDTSVLPDAEEISIGAGEVTVLSKGSTFRKLPSTSATPSGTIFQSPATWVSNPSSSPPAQGTLLMRSQQDGFVMSDQPGIFETTVHVWLASGDGWNQIPLATSAQLVVSVEDAVSIDPSPLNLTHFNNVKRVNVLAKPQRDSLNVSVGLPSQGSPPSTVLGVHRPNLDVSASPTSIEGFGLGESTVRVRVPGSYPASVSLSIETESASAKPKSLNIKPGTSGAFTIRSWGVGRENIRIEGGPFAEEGRAVEYNFVWPVYFIVFALMGSLVGGGIRYYRRRSAAGNQPVRLPGILTSGLLIGVIGAVLYGIGVAIIPGVPTGIGGQAIVFVVSAAAAVTGPSLPFEDTVTLT